MNIVETAVKAANIIAEAGPNTGIIILATAAIMVAGMALAIIGYVLFKIL